jgi:hypothetical protein
MARLARKDSQGGLPAMFFEEVKRTEGSHDEKNRRRSPPLSQAMPGSGDV